MKKIVIASSLLVLMACASEPTLQTEPNAQTSFDGLVKVDNSAFDQAWIAPDIDLKRYQHYIMQPVDFEFRAVRDTPRNTSLANASTSEFSLSEKQKQSLVSTVSEVFAEELARNKRFSATDNPGPNVLLVRTRLLDIVSMVPPETIGRSDVYLSELGAATLVLELVDSTSGETLARASSRSTIDTMNKNTDYRFLMESTSVSNSAEIKRWAKRWGQRFSNGLEGF